ncbi:MAG: hypothetical protein WA571_02245 [Candidatus Binatus sp.]|uniref:hypothetical protein n=1 Tax=Candidatus Binatus sp. TaxID=2811406 RepID=UPI003C72E007
MAGSYTASGTTTTSAPLFDLDGSTIGLVNAANVDAGPVTNYTYDPSGTPTASGTANDWPFQYQGMEKEFTNPAPYYYSGGGQFYSPQMVRSPSETGQTSGSGSGGGGGYSPVGRAISIPSCPAATAASSPPRTNLPRGRLPSFAPCLVIKDVLW